MPLLRTGRFSSCARVRAWEAAAARPGPLAVRAVSFLASFLPCGWPLARVLLPELAKTRKV